MTRFPSPTPSSIAPRCAHCGDKFEPRRAGDRRCWLCETAVAAQIADDERRRARVVWRPKVLTPWTDRRDVA